MAKRHLFTIILIVAAAVLILLGVLMTGNNSEPEVQGVSTRAEQVGLEVMRSSALTKQSVSEDSEQNGQLWRFVQPKSSQKEFVISAYFEQGESLTKLTSVTELPLREAVLGNVRLQLPKQYPEYKELNQRNLTINDIETTEIIFEYKSQNITIKQKLVLFFKNSDTVVYIRAQAKATEFNEISQKYLEPIIRSAKFVN